MPGFDQAQVQLVKGETSAGFRPTVTAAAAVGGGKKKTLICRDNMQHSPRALQTSTDVETADAVRVGPATF